MKNVRIMKPDPLFLGGIPAEHLGSHRAPVPVSLEAQDSRAPLPGLCSIEPHEFQRTLRRLGSGREQKGFLKLGGRELDELLDIIRTLLGRVGVGVEQRLMEQASQTFDDRRIAMPGIRDEYGRSEVDPSVAPRIMNLESLGAIPHDR